MMLEYAFSLAQRSLAVASMQMAEKVKLLEEAADQIVDMHVSSGYPRDLEERFEIVADLRSAVGQADELSPKDLSDRLQTAALYIALFEILPTMECQWD